MVFSPTQFLENIRKHDIFSTLVYFLEDKYKILEYPKLPSFSLKLPVFRRVVTGILVVRPSQLHRGFIAAFTVTLHSFAHHSSLLYPLTCSYFVVEEVGFTIGKAKNFWKYQKRDLCFKYIEMAIRCYLIATQLVEHGKIVDWFEGTCRYSCWNSCWCWSSCSSVRVNGRVQKFGCIHVHSFIRKIHTAQQYFV